MPGAAPKALLGMSGGVDSSMSAWLLKRDGYQVVAVTLLFHDSPQLRSKAQRAAAIAAQLGIEHHMVDARERFAQAVKARYVDEVSRGIASNPCVFCTSQLKIPLLLECADEHGCDFVATGHYADATHEPDGPGQLAHQLRAPLDRSKDQTFLLFQLTQDQLARLMFPLAHITKGVVRRTAMQAGLQRLSPLNDGQGTPCFFDEGGALEWLEGEGGIDSMSGDIVSISTLEVVGHHDGVHRHDVGSSLGDLGHVVAKDVASGVLYVGPANYGSTELCELDHMHWTSIEPPAKPRSCRARISHSATPVPAHLVATGEGAVATFTKPVSGLVAGQQLVFYSDDLVLGGGTVAR